MKASIAKLRPSPLLGDMTAYEALRFSDKSPVDLYLEGNEGPAPKAEIFDKVVALGPEIIRRYPSTKPLENQLAEMLGIEPNRVVVTAGADDALERAIRALGSPGREMILPVPTFEMIGRYASLAGCHIVEVPWLTGAFPLEKMISAISPNTSVITVVTPNSPTGLAVSRDDLKSLSLAAPDALLLVDLAYIDFADEDLTSAVLELPNAVAVRTLSKAWGLAGLRVGFACGNPQAIGWMRVTGHPYAVSSLSLKMASEHLMSSSGEVKKFTIRIKRERDELSELLNQFTKVSGEKSNANFVFGRYQDALWARDALRGLGIAVRGYPGKKYLDDALRITLPGNKGDFERLKTGLRTVFTPQAILFDIDDTLVDVSQSYRKATIETALEFGVTITGEDISRAKAGGDANNDWELTHRLVCQKDSSVTLEQVTEKFEQLYQGTDDNNGFCKTEKMLIDRNLLVRLAARYALGIVTGRPRSDAIAFLEREGIAPLFQAVITMDDGPLKPNPEPVRLALQRLGVSRGWFIGDTPDDIRSARGAGVLPLAVIAPADDPDLAAPALLRAGAARVLTDLSQLEELLP